MAIEDRDTFLIRAEVQRRHAIAAEERMARAARRAADAEARAVREAAAAENAPNDAPGLFGWLRRMAG